MEAGGELGSGRTIGGTEKARSKRVSSWELHFSFVGQQAQSRGNLIRLPILDIRSGIFILHSVE